MSLLRSIAVLFLHGLLLPTAIAQRVESTAHAPFPAYESGPRRPLLLAPDGARLYALNPADHRLEVFQVGEGYPRLRAVGQAFTGLEPVAMAFGDADTLFVINALSDSLAVVDLATLAVTEVLDVGDEPTDVLVTGGKLFVTCARAPADPSRPLGPGNRLVDGVLQVFDAASLVLLRQVPLGLVQPRAMATDGRHVYITPQHAGSRTVTIPYRRMRQRQPRRPSMSAELSQANPTLHSPRLLEREGSGWSRPHTGLILNEVDAGQPLHVDRDLIAVDVESLEVHEAATIELGSSFFALEFLHDRLWLAGIRGFNLGNSEPELSGSAFDNLVYELEPTPGSDATAHQLEDYENVVSHALPVAVAGFQDGARERVFVASLGSSAIVELDPDGGFVQAVPCEELPMGLAVDVRRKLLHVWCRTGPEILTFDLVGRSWTHAGEESLLPTPPGSLPALHEISRRTPLTFNPEPPLFAAGRRHLYEAHGDHGNGTMSCASCHQFGDHDHLAWNLGDPGGGIAAPYAALLDADATPVTDPSMPQMHPRKGPMMTQSLRGLDGVQPLHWRGDRRFVQSFRGAFRGLQGGHGLSLKDMQELATFLDALRFPPNPHQPREVDDPLIARGEELFHGMGDIVGCVQCHRRFDGQGPGSPLAGRLFALGQPQLLKAPDLRGAYTKESGALLGHGPGHEGASADLRRFLDRHPPVPDGNLDQLTEEDRDALAAFVRAFDSGEDPFVGWQQPLNATCVDEADRWLARVLDRRQRVRVNGEARFDVVLKLWSEQDGVAVANGAVLVTSDDDTDFRFDDGYRVAWAVVRDEIAEGLARGFALVVPAGTGQRLGIDRDEDGLFDAIERDRLGTFANVPDTDRDEAGDTSAPRVLSHEVHAVFSSTATLEVVTDEPCALFVTVKTKAGTQPVRGSVQLRRRHQVLLDELPAGEEVHYVLGIGDRSGNAVRGDQGVAGSFRTRPHALHVDAVELSLEQGAVVARIRIVDQDQDVVNGIPVHALWHFASDDERGIADRLDRTARAATTAEGAATLRLPLSDLPAHPVLVSIGVLGLGSSDPEDRWFVGHPGEEPSFFYEQPLNSANAASLVVER